MIFFRFFSLLAALFLLLSCTTNKKQQNGSDGSVVKMEYARNIHIYRFSDGYKVVLDDPWHSGQVLQTYYLMPQGSKTLDHNDGVSIRIPIRRAVITTTAHANLVEMLGKKNAVVGVTDPQYMLIPDIISRLKSGKIVNCGSSMTLDMEKIASLSPDAVFLSPYENSSSDYDKLASSGVTTILIADYMEPTALGRAEWMKFYGILFGCKDEADKLFSIVNRNYNSLKKKASRLSQPSVLPEKMSGTTWYVPGGKSSTGTMLADAGADYVFSSDKHVGSIPLSLEQILTSGATADIWFFSYYSPKYMTRGDLLTENNAYSQLSAFRSGHVYAVNTMKVPFFEEVSFRPDKLLRDYIIMFHPGIIKGKPRYYSIVK